MRPIAEPTATTTLIEGNTMSLDYEPLPPQPLYGIDGNLLVEDLRFCHETVEIQARILGAAIYALGAFHTAPAAQG
jgi:hypothetical protein